MTSMFGRTPWGRAQCEDRSGFYRKPHLAHDSQDVATEIGPGEWRWVSKKDRRWNMSGKVARLSLRNGIHPDAKAAYDELANHFGVPADLKYFARST